MHSVHCTVSHIRWNFSYPWLTYKYSEFSQYSMFSQYNNYRFYKFYNYLDFYFGVEFQAFFISEVNQSPKKCCIFNTCKSLKGLSRVLAQIRFWSDLPALSPTSVDGSHLNKGSGPFKEIGTALSSYLSRYLCIMQYLSF